MGRSRRILGALVRRAAGTLPPPRDEAALRAARAVRDLVTGRAPAPPPRRAKPRPRRAYGAPVGPPVPKPRPIEPDTWLDPPVSQRQGLTSQLHDHGPTGRTTYDVALLEQLNEEYRDRPIVPSPRLLTPEAFAADARKKVAWGHFETDLIDATVLEVGCGNGYEVWSLAHNLGCDAHGVDIQEPEVWQDLAGERVHFTCTDLATHNPFPDDTFDRIVSFTVWEHVLHPYKLLEETFRITKPGGLQFIRANLWAGPQASHRYRDLYFPWPHHLFSDEVIAAWDEKNGRGPEGAAWVNKLTWNHYERYLHDIGWKIRKLSFQKAAWDEEFYQRFEDVLGRIPRWDLERDFFSVVVEKPAR